MEGKREWHLKLKLEDSFTDNIEEHIYFPLYFNCYKEALRYVLLRILKNRHEKIECEGRFEYAYQKDSSNIISFIGERGSGKTTCMVEFGKILEKFDSRGKFAWWINQCIVEEDLKTELENINFYFTVLNPIDASSLEAKEDLFELILAAIYRKFEENQGRHNPKVGGLDPRRQILKLFEEILSGYYAVKNVRNEEFGDSFITKLKYMSSSMDIKDKIDQLTELLLREEKSDGEGYFVIAIDDLDLNIENGYEMLEQIHKYFFNDKIFIMLTYDYNEITKICEKSYFKAFDEKRREDGYYQHICNLSRDYITKIFPVNGRIFMPDMKKMTRKIKVGSDELLAKEYIMRKIAQKMRIFYDSQGLKKHFCEAATVRELVDYSRFLDSLLEIDFELWDSSELGEKQKEQYMIAYDQNHERFNWDILYRLANRLLDDENREIFEELMQKKLERRAAHVCDMNKEQADADLMGRYSYADFLETIYKLGRKSEEKKKLIKCILASFTSEMVREKISYLKNQSEQPRKDSIDRLKSFLGNSFGGEWTKSLVPPRGTEYDELVNREGKYSIEFSRNEFNNFHLGYMENAQWRNFRVSFSIVGKKQEWIEKIVTLQNDKRTIDSFVRTFLDWLEEKKVIATLECLTMFYDWSAEEKSLNLKIEFGIDQESTSIGKYLIVTGSNHTSHWDIMGFVKKTLNYKENNNYILDVIAGSLVDGLYDYVKKLDFKDVKWKEKMRERIREGISGQSIHAKIPWNNFPIAAFPFYDVDLSYNVIKRTRRELMREDQKIIKKSDCYQYILEVYQKITYLLEKQKSCYGGSERPYRKDLHYKYGEDFERCPYVKAFVEKDNYLNENFQEMLGQMIFNNSEPERIRPADMIFE